MVGITGSCGKTTTKNMLMELLRDEFDVVGSPASFNNDVGVPHTLLLATERTGALVVEMGTNAPGEIAGLCRTARPNCGIITNVGASHLEEARVLNHPTTSMRRYELLRTLFERGDSSFNVYRLTECRQPQRWPVFIREENEHTHNMTE